VRMWKKAVVGSAILILSGAFVMAHGQESALPAQYPLDFCIVSGQKLGSMGEPVDYMHEGRLIRLCCSGCLRAFQRDPAKYLAELDKHQAQAGQAVAGTEALAAANQNNSGCRH